MIMRKTLVVLLSPLLFTSLSGCAEGSEGLQPSEDFSSAESEYRLDYEQGMLWANSLTQQFIQQAEESGSEYPRYEGFFSAVSQMLDLYGSLEKGCSEVVDYNFSSDFPEGPNRDAWVEGCVSQMERAQETADSIKPSQ